METIYIRNDKKYKDVSDGEIIQDGAMYSVKGGELKPVQPFLENKTPADYKGKYYFYNLIPIPKIELNMYDLKSLANHLSKSCNQTEEEFEFLIKCWLEDMGLQVLLDNFKERKDAKENSKI